MSIRLPFWATLMSVLGIIVLCTLGSWQLQRLAWKTEIIAKLDAAYESENSKAIDIANFEDSDFTYGRVSGTFLPQKALLLGPKTKDKKIGYDLIVPLKQKKATILINMGWTEWELEELPIYHLKNKWVWFEGLARAPGWNSFTPENVPEEELWFKPDIDNIATIKNLKNPAPFMLYAEHASHKFDASFPNNARWSPNNNHLQYAIFWFIMALALAVIYGLRFLRKQG
ncbi:MAG: SURF1-like protein [Micavibrio sp.]|nr:MAG: SURF1-like protein [Micavibrio sp.]